MPDKNTLIRAWVEALESGHYAQTNGELRTDDGQRYCCLGVQCNVFDPDGWSDSYMYQGFWGFPPAYVLEAYDISHSEAASYGNLNDNGRSFATIARAIRNNHPEAFA